MRADSAKLSRARKLAAQIDATPIDLAEALWKAEKAQPGYIRQIVKEDGARLKYRRARYLVSVWDRFAGLGFPRELLARVGWTKLALIARHCPAGMEASWLEFAQPGRSTVKELEEKLKNGGWGKPKAHSMLLRLSPAQNETLVRVLLKFGAKVAKNGRGLVGKERALIEALGHLTPD